MPLDPDWLSKLRYQIFQVSELVGELDQAEYTGAARSDHEGHATGAGGFPFCNFDSKFALALIFTQE
jgi:hypothetical protein